MKRFFYLTAFSILCFCSVCILSSCSSVKTLNVYNWGQYISDGKYGYDYDTIAEFEKYYEETYGERIKVNYTTFDSNEDMYAKIKSGASNYDVVFPSDYIVDRMIDEDLLAKIDYSNIPNYEYIGEQFKGLYFDENNEYTVPYTYGVLGIIYNANVVDEKDVESLGWSIFWEEKYSNEILMINNSRDAFGIAMYDLGIDVNTTDVDQWELALQHLKANKPLVQAYVMDEVFNKMESGEASICAYYAGDYFTMLENASSDVDLRFYQPDVTNVFIDCMCIPKSSNNKELAEIFINFMLSKDAAIANAEYVYYASPNSTVYSDEDYLSDIGEDADILYPEEFDFKTQISSYGYRNLDDSTLSMINSLWEEMKVDSGSSDTVVYIICIVIIVVFGGAAIYYGIRKKKRAKYYD